MNNLIERLRGAATCVYLATGKDQADALSKILHEAADAISEAEAESERRLARIMQLGQMITKSGTGEIYERNRRGIGEWVAHYIAKPLLIFMGVVMGVGVPAFVVWALWTALTK